MLTAVICWWFLSSCFSFSRSMRTVRLGCEKQSGQISLLVCSPQVMHAVELKNWRIVDFGLSPPKRAILSKFERWEISLYLWTQYPIVFIIVIRWNDNYARCHYIILNCSPKMHSIVTSQVLYINANKAGSAIDVISL